VSNTSTAASSPTSAGSKINWGVAAGWMGKGVVGVEEDFKWSPDFFGHGGQWDSSRVVTLMTNVIVGAPIGGQKGGGIRPYAALGVGYIGQKIKTVTDVGNFVENDFGWDIGAGVMGYFSDNVGLRFDWHDAYVDIRGWSYRDWGSHQELSNDLTAAGRGDLVQRSFGDRLFRGLFDSFREPLPGNHSPNAPRSP